MAVKQFFKSEHTGVEFEVVSYDAETNQITLKGPLGEFTETYDKDKFKELGYKGVKRDVPDDAEAEAE
jgi:hypothetical protein